MMDILILQLLEGEPINEVQAKQVIQQEFGPIWDGKNAEPTDPSDSKEVRSTKYQMGVYLAAVKASLLDQENHGGWPTGYGKMRVEGFPRLLLEQLELKAKAPLDKVNRTIVNFAMIPSAWILDDKEAMARSDLQRKTDWPEGSFIDLKAARLKSMSKYMFPRK